LVKLLLKKPTLFDISLKEIDWKFYTQIRNELLHASTLTQVQELQDVVTERIEHPRVDQGPTLKVSWENFFNKPTIPTFLNRKLVFYDSVLHYRQKTIETLVQYGEQLDPRCEGWLKQAFMADSYNSNKVTKNIPFLKKFKNLYGFLELSVNRRKLPIKRRFNNSRFYQTTFVKSKTSNKTIDFKKYNKN
jgi:hypothetical protein